MTKLTKITKMTPGMKTMLAAVKANDGIYHYIDSRKTVSAWALVDFGLVSHEWDEAADAYAVRLK